MKFSFNPQAWRDRELYVGLMGVLIGLIFMFGPDRNDGLYLIYPKVVSVGLIVIGAVTIGGSLFFRRVSDIGKSKVTVTELVILLILLVTRPLMSTIGLYTTVFLAGLAISLIIRRDKSPRAVAGAVIFNLVLIAALYLAFAVLLKVNAPDALLI